MSTAELGSRTLFDALQYRAYLNHAAVSPPSRPVREAVTTWLDRYARVGLGAIPPAMEQRGRLKESLARLLGCGPTDLAITSSTSRGLMEIANAIALAPGDRVICFDGEFPTNVTPWQTTAAASDAQVELLPQAELDDDALLEGVQQALKAGGVRLIACSAVQFSTGRVMPIETLAQLAHDHGAAICVDAIQALGVMPLDVGALGIDYLCGGAHKWLMGLEGTGFVYAAPSRLETLRPRTAGWLSHEDPFGFLTRGPGHLRYDRPLRSGIDVLEAHSLSVLGCVALEASLDLIHQLGVPAIHAHVQRYLGALEAGMTDLGFQSLRQGPPSGILSMLPPPGDTCVAWVRDLDPHGIATSGPDGKLRMSPHWPNALEEVDLILEAVRACR